MERFEKFVNVLETWRKLLMGDGPSESPVDMEPPAEQPRFGCHGFMAV